MLGLMLEETWTLNSAEQVSDSTPQRVKTGFLSVCATILKKGEKQMSHPEI